MINLDDPHSKDEFEVTAPDFSEFNFTISIESVAETVKEVNERTHEQRT